MNKPYWKFEYLNWASEFVKLPEPPTMEILWPILQDAGFNGRKKNYRVVPLPNGDYELQSRFMSLTWRTCQVIPRVEVAHVG